MELLKDLYTVREAAQLLSVTEDAIRKYIKGGKLKASKFGKSYAIVKSDLEEFTAARGE